MSETNAPDGFDFVLRGAAVLLLIAFSPVLAVGLLLWAIGKLTHRWWPVEPAEATREW